MYINLILSKSEEPIEIRPRKVTFVERMAKGIFALAGVYFVIMTLVVIVRAL